VGTKSLVDNFGILAPDQSFLQNFSQLSIELIVMLDPKVGLRDFNDIAVTGLYTVNNVPIAFLTAHYYKIKVFCWHYIPLQDGDSALCSISRNHLYFRNFVRIRNYMQK
jgi:hypothetical protein